MTNPITVLFKKTHSDAHLPEYMTKGAAGADLYAVMDNCDFVRIPVMARAIIPCGFAVEIPEGFEMQIRPRSGLALKQGLTVLNAPGTVDSDYRGEIGVLLVNLGNSDAIVKTGDRIAQMVIAPVSQPKLEWTQSELGETGRGQGGFGSTGVSVAA